MRRTGRVSLTVVFTQVTAAIGAKSAYRSDSVADIGSGNIMKKRIIPVHRFVEYLFVIQEPLDTS